MSTVEKKSPSVGKARPPWHERVQSGRQLARNWRLLGLLGLCAAVLLASLPWVLSHTPLGTTLAKRVANRFGLNLKINSIEIGWFSSLHLQGVSIAGPENKSPLTISQVQSDVGLFDLLGIFSFKPGEWVLRGVTAHAYLVENQFSFEKGLRALLEKGQPKGLMHGDHIRVQDISLEVTDLATGECWRVQKCDAEILMQEQNAELSWSGVLSELEGASGSFRGKFTEQLGTGNENSTGRGSRPWRLEFQSQSVPISAVGLIPRRFSKSTLKLPPALNGYASGQLVLSGDGRGTSQFELRDFKLLDVELLSARGLDVLWSNKLASMDGKIILTPEKIIARQLSFSNDLMRLNVDASGSPWLGDFTDASRLREWLPFIDGNASLQIDLAALKARNLRFLNIEPGADIQAGILKANFAARDADAGKLADCDIELSNYQSNSARGEFRLPEASLMCQLEYSPDHLHVTKLELDSSLANLDSQIEKHRGTSTFQLDLHQASQTLQRFLGNMETEVQGSLAGRLDWELSSDGNWNVQTRAEATQLQISQANGPLVAQEQMQLTLDSGGIWDSSKAIELSKFEFKVHGPDLDLSTRLAAPVRITNLFSQFPLLFDCQGDFDYLAAALAVWYPNQLIRPEGSFALKMKALLSPMYAEVRQVDLELMQPRLSFNKVELQQPHVHGKFNGTWSWPTNYLEIKQFSAECPAFSAEAQGVLDEHSQRLSVAWRSELAELVKAMQLPTAPATILTSRGSKTPAAGLLNSRLDRNPELWHLAGELSGELKVEGNSERLTIKGDAVAKELALLQPILSELKSAASASTDSLSQHTHPRADSSTTSTPQATTRLVSQPGNRNKLLWFEPEMSLHLQSEYQAQQRTMKISQLELQSEWLELPLSADVDWNGPHAKAEVTGDAQIRLSELGQRLTSLIGIGIKLRGTHQAPVRFELAKLLNGRIQVRGQTQLGWEGGELAGLEFGAAEMPLAIDNANLRVTPTQIPVGQGQVNFGGEIKLSRSPVELELLPGKLAQSIELSHEVTSRWVKFLAPPISRLESVQSTLDIDLDEGRIYLGAPQRNRVSGALHIENTQTMFSPMMKQLLETYLVLRADLQNLAGTSLVPVENDVTMPSQTIEFWMGNGIINHKKILFVFDGQSIECTGNVRLDGQLNMLARLPRKLLQPNMDTSNPDVYLFMPVSGTIFLPKIDPTGISNLKTMFTSTAANRMRDSLQQQLESEASLLKQGLDLAEELSAGRTAAGEPKSPK
ncbi:MAG: hypothetical protein NXI32_13220 [bacterium]|nr:hypothetical protein [bacterium]